MGYLLWKWSEPKDKKKRHETIANFESKALKAIFDPENFRDVFCIQIPLKHILPIIKKVIKTVNMRGASIPSTPWTFEYHKNNKSYQRITISGFIKIKP